MATLARFRKQRQVTRNPWKKRFTTQRINQRGSSTQASFSVPTLTSISPATTTAAGAPIVITCTGTNFVSGITKVTVGVVDHATTYVSATSVTFVFPRPQVPSTWPVNVHNGGKFSTTPRTLTLT